MNYSILNNQCQYNNRGALSERPSSSPRGVFEGACGPPLEPPRKAVSSSGQISNFEISCLHFVQPSKFLIFDFWPFDFNGEENEQLRGLQQLRLRLVLEPSVINYDRNKGSGRQGLSRHILGLRPAVFHGPLTALKS